jgi:hypothetical protein
MEFVMVMPLIDHLIQLGLSNTQLVGVDGSILIFNQIKTELREREWG